MASKYVAYRLRTTRKMLGLKQHGAAKLIGATPTQLMEWECGKRMPSDKYLRRICALYQTLPDALYPEQRQEAAEFVRDRIRKYGPHGTNSPEQKA